MSQFPEEQKSGSFQRQEDSFRRWVGRDDDLPPTPGRYHLYVSLACPWAHRSLIVRKLLGLEEVIGISVADPVRDDRGWAFREGNGHGLDLAEGFRFQPRNDWGSELHLGKLDTLALGTLLAAAFNRRDDFLGIR